MSKLLKHVKLIENSQDRSEMVRNMFIINFAVKEEMKEEEMKQKMQY